MRGGLRLAGRLAPSYRLAGPPGGRRYAVALLLLLLVLPVWWLANRDEAEDAGPARLDQLVLDGPRGPECLRLVIAVDDSGSMSDFASARDRALHQFLGWVGRPGNLRSDDELAVVDFAFESAVRLPPSPPSSGVGALTGRPVTDGFDTLFRPVLETVSGFPPTDCSTALALLSDAQLSDLPATEAVGRRILRGAGVDDVRLLVPGDGITVPAQWQQVFPAAAPDRFDGHDTEQTARTFGETVADLVDQTLVRRSGAP